VRQDSGVRVWKAKRSGIENRQELPVFFCGAWLATVVRAVVVDNHHGVAGCIFRIAGNAEVERVRHCERRWCSGPAFPHGNR